MRVSFIEIGAGLVNLEIPLETGRTIIRNSENVIQLKEMFPLDLNTML
jgi:hypothetical protein